MAKHLYKRNVLLSLFLLTGLFACSLLIFNGFSLVNRHFAVPTPDITDAALIDFTTLLGPEWLKSPGESDRPDIRDLLGEYDVKGSIGRTTRNKENRNVFIAQHVIRYVNEQVAHERYLRHERYFAQEEKSFADSDSNTEWWENTPIYIELKSDCFHLSCEASSRPIEEQKNRCVALLRYGDTVIHVNMWNRWDSKVYLSMDDITAILRAVDERMTNINR